MSQATSSQTFSLANVEDGYAEVVRNGRRCGAVSREKYGSTRTGTRWTATSGRTILGYGYTRAEAVAIVVKHREDRDAALAAFGARS